jgi:hypothetical protein
VRNILVTVALLAVGWGARFGWNTITAVRSPSPSAIESAAETDVRVAEDLREGKAAPARGWLGAEHHLSFEAHPTAMNEWIEAFHAAGAERVWIVGIEEFGGSQVSDTIAVELPPAGADRERVLSVEARLRDGECSEDVGQRYVTVRFD